MEKVSQAQFLQNIGFVENYILTLKISKKKKRYVFFKYLRMCTWNCILFSFLSLNSNTGLLLKQVYATALSSQKLSGSTIIKPESSTIICFLHSWKYISLPQHTVPIYLFIGSRPRRWVADYTVSTCPWQIWLGADFLLERHNSLKWDLCKLAKSCDDVTPHW